MREILRFIAPALRGAGFRGSGRNYRKAEGDFIFIINFQGSRWGSDFYVNLAAQPTFVPLLHDAPLARLKEYECFLRRRVGTSWPWDMSAGQAASFQAQLLGAQRDFFAHAQTMRSALAVGQAEVLVATFSAGTTRALAAAQLARAALALGHPEKARQLASLGLELAGAKAWLLREEMLRIKNGP